MREPRTSAEKLHDFLDRNCQTTRSDDRGVEGMAQAVNRRLWHHRSRIPFSQAREASKGQKALYRFLQGMVREPLMKFDVTKYPMPPDWTDVVKNDEALRDEALRRTLVHTLTTLLIYGDEAQQRLVDPRLSELMDIFGDTAIDLRDLVASEALGGWVSANSTMSGVELVQELDGLAENVERVANYRHFEGPESWQEFQSYIANAIETADRIKRRWIDTTPFDEAGNLSRQRDAI